MSAVPEAAPPALEVRDLAKRFGGLRAVDGCTFAAEARAITGLIGPNGAGKSTALGLIAGAIRPDRGEVWFFGRPAPVLAHAVARAGVARTFQVPQEFGRMTVLENLMVASPEQPGERIGTALRGRGAWRAREEAELERAWALLDRFRLAPLADEYAANLSGGQKKLLEFARALQNRPRLLLLDEPMAGVNPVLRDDLERHIEGFAAEGISVLMIEHEMGIVSRLCRSVVVMAQGRVIARGPFSEVRRDPGVIAAYLGQAAGAGAADVG